MMSSICVCMKEIIKKIILSKHSYLEYAHISFTVNWGGGGEEERERGRGERVSNNFLCFFR